VGFWRRDARLARRGSATWPGRASPGIGRPPAADRKSFIIASGLYIAFRERRRRAAK